MTSRISFKSTALSSVHSIFSIDPFPNMSAPARLRLPVPYVSTKPLKSSLSLHAKIFFTSETRELSTAKGIIMKQIDLCYM